MAIEFQQDEQLFTLNTRHTTYQMKVDRLGFLRIMGSGFWGVWIIC